MAKMRGFSAHERIGSITLSLKPFLQRDLESIGVATAAACALLGFDCAVYMGYCDTQIGSFAFILGYIERTLDA